MPRSSSAMRIENREKTRSRSVLGRPVSGPESVIMESPGKRTSKRGAERRAAVRRAAQLLDCAIDAAGSSRANDGCLSAETALACHESRGESVNLAELAAS